MSAPAVPPWPWQKGASTARFRVACTRLYAAPNHWQGTYTRVVDAINHDDAIQLIEREILDDGDDCYGFSVEALRA